MPDHSIQISTPALVRELYSMLSADGKAEFRKQLTQLLTAQEVLAMAAELPKSQQFEYSRFSFAKMSNDILPLVIQRLLVFVRNDPQSIHHPEFEKKLLADVREWGKTTVRHLHELERELIKKERDPKPRKTDRDDEIVRLHDVDDKSFGEIGPALVRINPKWARKDGRPMTYAAVEKAYHRRKDRPTN